MKQVLVLINPKSGVGGPYRFVAAIEKTWDTPERDISFQFSQSAEDGAGKARRAIKRGVDTILVVGGDGMVNTIGCELVGTNVRLGVIPAGSGNGFARHFGIPLHPAAAAEALLNGYTAPIDVGRANGRLFFVTCSMAWDGALVEAFEKFPFRGIVPYVLAGAQQLFEYKPQPFEVDIDGETLNFKHPLIFTVANLSQFGSDVLVAPDAQADSGDLELVAIETKDMPIVLSQVHRFIEKTFHLHPLVTNRHFKNMTVRRKNPSPIQIDGELMKADAEVRIEVLPSALNVIIPN
ncbi:diacylglycerol/lipid kinase family protein [Pontiella sulfatireligans]|uniref:Diacylglycerol kinase n=1 Tax=Pontiella sulfatireligans TaxID=2750658 RepID=A0A6C2UPH6_9BACT|nr:diacylglycerol kinase family protein [Pontiella sulfatireligans]VGO20916.1 Diacylglycerol kinase [Pontiella sulfatireligans]